MGQSRAAARMFYFLKGTVKYLPVSRGFFPHARRRAIARAGSSSVTANGPRLGLTTPLQAISPETASTSDPKSSPPKFGQGFRTLPPNPHEWENYQGREWCVPASTASSSTSLALPGTCPLRKKPISMFEMSCMDRVGSLVRRFKNWAETCTPNGEENTYLLLLFMDLQLAGDRFP